MISSRIEMLKSFGGYFQLVSRGGGYYDMAAEKIAADCIDLVDKLN